MLVEGLGPPVHPLDNQAQTKQQETEGVTLKLGLLRVVERLGCSPCS